MREWHDDEGWGVVESDATLGGCWAHGTTVLVTGVRTLRAGSQVELTFEVAEQDGHASRAVEVWPAGETPVRAVAGPGSSAAYSSSLTLTLDGAVGDDGDDPPPDATTPPGR